MGAYENPEQLVDTQTGQHLRNLQANVAGAFSDYTKVYIAKEANVQAELKKQQAINAKKLSDDQKEVEDYALTLRTKMGESQEGNKELNLSDTFEPLIQEAVKLKSGLLSGTIQDRQAAIARIAKINGSVSGFTNSLAEFDSYSNDLETLMLKPIGTEGALSQEMPAGDIRAIRIMQGRLPGSKKAIYEDGDPDKLAWEIYEPGNSVPIKKYYANKMKDMDIYSDGDFVRAVPDMSTSNQKLKDTVNTVFETKTQTVKGEEIKESTGRLTEAMLLTNESGEIDYQKEYVGGQPGAYKLVAKVDKNRVMGNGDINVLLKSRIDGMTDSEIIIYNNNILDKTIKSAPTLENVAALTKEQREKFLENYKEHFWNTQVKHTQDLLREDNSVQIFNDPKPTKVSKSTKGTTPTGTQRNQVDFNARIKEVIDTGEGGVSKGGYTLMKMNGKWGVYDKDGLEKPGTENITNPTVLATFIGGTLKKPLK